MTDPGLIAWSGRERPDCGCREFLRLRMAEIGSDTTVSTAPPLVPSPYGENCFKCPHGTTYWIEPTGEQIAEWVRDGVA